MGLSYEHRHDTVKFSNVSGTSTTDTEMMIKLAVVNDRRWEAPLPHDATS